MTLRRAISGATAAVLVLLSAVTTGGAAAAEPDTGGINAEPAATVGVSTNPTRPAALAAPSKEVDPATHHEFPGVEDTDYYISSRNPGRIWTDKTVFSTDVAVPKDMQDEENPIPDLQVGEDELAVALSAVGSTRHVSREVPTPVDVSLIIDNSTSMRQCVGNTNMCTGASADDNPYTKSRAAAMVEALNVAIGIIAENPANRIAVTQFSENSGEFVDLGTPKNAPRPSAQATFIGGPYVYLTHSGSTMTLTMTDDTRTGNARTRTLTVGGGSTNIHRGVATGMGLLAQANSVTGENQRIPNVILFTDGEPTYSASVTNWWAPGASGANHGPNSPTATQYYGNGFKAALTASLLKNKIEAVYNDEAFNLAHARTPVEASVYTIGLGVSGLSEQGRQLAYATLDPGKTNPATPTVNPMLEQFNVAFGEYNSSGSPEVLVNRTTGQNPQDVFFRVTHPTVNGYVEYEPTTLRYNKEFHSPVTQEDLERAFESIAQQIVDPPNYPVEVSSSTATDGYVTFVDELGPYMQVTDFNRLAFCSVVPPVIDPNDCANVTFTNPTRTPSGLTDTYVFKGQYPANGLGASPDDEDISSIHVTVTRGATLAQGDIVTVKIPAAMLPIYDKQIKLAANGTPTITPYASHPLHAYYKVAPKAEVLSFLGDVTTTLSMAERDALTAYINDHTDSGKVRFYSNAFDAGSAAGKTTATFTPAKKNDFYRFSVDTPLFRTDGSPLLFSDWATLDESIPLYYEDIVYINEGNGPEAVKMRVDTTVTALLAAKTDTMVVKQGPLGQAVAPAGMRDYGSRPRNLDHSKCAPDALTWDEGSPVPCAEGDLENTTGTASMVRVTKNEQEQVVVALGNNGYLEYEVPGRLTITKRVAAGLNLDPNDDDEFRFSVEFTGAPGVYPFGVYALTNMTAPLYIGEMSSGDTITLLADQRAVIAGLPDGATYKVTEFDLPPGYEPVSATPEGVIAVPQAQPVAVEFLNTYAPTRTDAVATPTVAKEIDGRGWVVGDAFKARLCPGSGPVTVPLPNPDEGGCQTVILDTDGHTKDFGTLSFTTPGTYTYTLTEVGELAPGFSYSAAEYRWVVDVYDDYSGVLQARTRLEQTRSDNGDPVNPGLEVIGSATFTNTYAVGSVSGPLDATKRVVDSTASDGDGTRAPKLSHAFRYWYLDVEGGDDAGAPAAPTFPDGTPGGTYDVEVRSTPDSSSVASPRLTFTQAHVGHAYYYAVEEIDGRAEGVTYDQGVFIYRLEVTGPAPGDVPSEGLTVHVTPTRCEVPDKRNVDFDALLSACTDYKSDTYPVFTNYYDAEAAEVPLGGTKVLTGRPWVGTDAFTFTLEGFGTETLDAIARGDVILPGVSETVVSVTVDADAAADEGDGSRSFTFDSIAFKRQGAYQFVVKEQIPTQLLGLTYDEHWLYYDVIVTDDDVDGQLDFVVIAQDGEPSRTFANQYSAYRAFSGVDVLKVLTGRELRLNEFEFRVSPENAASAARLNISPEGKTVASGERPDEPALTTVLGPVTFDQDDLGEHFTFNVSEVKGSAPGVTYDDRAYTVILKPVYDAESGELDVLTTVTVGLTTTTYSARAAEQPVVTFTNAYAPTTWDLAKSSDRDATVTPGQEITYTLTATNTSKEGAAPLTSVVITDDLSDVLGAADNPKAHWVGFVGDGGKYASIDGSTLTWELDELSGTKTLSYTVVVDDAAHDVTLRNAVTGMGGVDPEGGGGGEVPPESCVAGTPVADLDDDCVTVHVTGPAWTIAKSSPTATEVKPGDTIVYVVDVTFLGNEGSVIPGVVVIDDLSDVLEHATLDQESIDPLVGEAELVDGTLRWTIGDLTENARLTYAVRVNDDAHGVDLVNVVTGSGGTGEDGDDEGEIPPIACATDEVDPECTTVHSTDPAWTIAKASPTATEVNPGDTIEYVVDVTLLGDEGRSIPSVVVIDDLSDVLEHATLDQESIDPSVGEAELLDDGTLRWDIGNLTEDATLRYSVTVNRDAKAYGATLRNLAWGTSTGADVDDGEPEVVPPAQCTEMSPCSTDHEVATPTWTIEKSSDSVAVPGGMLTYELTVTNTGDIPLWGATITDGPVAHGEGVTDIWDFLDGGGWDGKYTVRVGEGEIEYLEDTNRSDGLQHTITELGAGEHVVVTFTVKLPDQLDGIHLRNTVTGSLIPDPAGPGEAPNPSFPPADCAIPSGEAPCSVDHTYPPSTEWTLDKTAVTPSGTSSVKPGDTVTYTLTVQNTDAKNAVTQIVVTDDLAEVLADGVVTLDALAVPDAGTVRQEGTTLIWDVGTLAAGKTVTYTYSVTVVESATAYGTTLHNAAWGTGRGITEDGLDEVLPPVTCAEADPCSTDHEVPVPEWMLAKSSDTDTAAPGGDITYRLTVTNTGDVPLYDAQIADGPREQAKGITDIWSALGADGWNGAYTVQIDDGDPVGYTDTDVSDGLQAELAMVPVGSTAVVTFTVTLPTTLETVHLRNTVTGALPGDPDGPGYAPAGCSEPGPDDVCSADHEYVVARMGPPPSENGPSAVTGGEVLGTVGTKLAALVAAAGLMTVAGLLLVRRRREESTE
ncbi:conserved repeat domain protein [Xylanimonas cellulosilytica DSM 15894]|uniref:Conserved repeat domain protein n=1 Tax=Xylanimonas cellulosilytica (strain DSM 15894 / JCM 12276 / CECT 5975 / KCTC 9989 / LMG 20990 / NBRC 107835 / XIL07) TaxID=446471 RepID=D1BU24_XYLCX|nr:FctA domain-containing protein [Xylanimonas cellulosilytica]ACZ29188.1 conserved repeat domain protein [Xylanimonas cellulosilytica DSM 15894]